MKEPEAKERFDEEEEAGGPVKSFLEHLEDLRWMLIKSVVALFVAMLVCMVAGNVLVQFLTWPLRHAQIFAPRPSTIPVFLGTNLIANIPTNVVSAAGSSNAIGSLRLTPVQSGTNWLLSVQADPLPANLPLAGVPLLKNYGPLEGVIVAVKLAIYGGLILSSPFVLFFIGQFVLPALRVREKTILFRAVAFGTGLFFLGVTFCYFIIAGVTLLATVQFSQWMGFAADEWRAAEYISFMCQFMLGMGLAFELPVVILTVVKIGLLDYKKLKSFRQYAIVANLVMAGFITPGADPLSMLLLAVPMQFLYEISVWVAWYWEWKAKRQAQRA